MGLVRPPIGTEIQIGNRPVKYEIAQLLPIDRAVISLHGEIELVTLRTAPAPQKTEFTVIYRSHHRYRRRVDLGRINVECGRIARTGLVIGLQGDRIAVSRLPIQSHAERPFISDRAKIGAGK